MKLKKLISAFSALAIAVSMFSAFSVAEAASLGGKPSVKISFDSYDKKTDSVAFAYVNITIDMTAAENLEAYSNTLDEETWEEVVKGNGITTLGAKWTVPEGFTYTSSMSTVPEGFTINKTGDVVTFGPQTNAENYCVDPITTIKVAYRVADFDTKGDMELLKNSVTVDGKNSEESKVWSYASLADTIDIAGCSVPSYNEWSAPTPTVDWSTATQFGSDYHSDIDNSDAVAYTATLTGDGTEYDTVTWKVTPAEGAAKGCYANTNIGGEGAYTIGLVIGDVTSDQITSVEAALGSQGNAQ